ncbi:EamA family transporter [Infirmifilum sp. NZ]|uniref:EamA family transporter n=1 Tax=Infirmifilum sp. NZ TaxID=2926850 RepID=UPI0027A82C1B|nr:EamA family transporter [Infirmifilum sp. NZ]UNQ74284.1 EamA family transporter [Infirmifilum sp. NZ]
MSDIAWLVYALLDALFAALATIFAKMGLSRVDPVVATGLRSIVMMVFTVSVMLLIRDKALITSLTTRETLFIILSGVAGALSWLLYFVALQYGKAVNVAVVDRSSILFIIVLAALVLGEEITVKKAVAAGLVLVALVLIST